MYLYINSFASYGGQKSDASQRAEQVIPAENLHNVFFKT